MKEVKNTIITNIFWKRTYLFIEYESKKEIKLAIHNEKHEITHILETKQLDTNKYRAKINITIAEGRELLKKGSWSIIDFDTGQNLKATDEVLYNLEYLDRVFRYGGNFYAYTITFHISIDPITEELSIVLKVIYMKTNKHEKRKKDLFIAANEASSITSLIKKSGFVIAKTSINLYYLFWNLIIPKKGNRILFLSENMDHIRDNMDAIDRRLKERSLDKKYKITYFFKNIFNKKQNPFEWLHKARLIAKQDYIFVDDYIPIFSFLSLSKKTILIQCWHAGFGFKLVGYGRFGISGSPHPSMSCHRKYTYGIVGNDQLREIYSEVWGIEKESLLSTGMPRLEHFLDKEYQQKFKQEFYQKYPLLKEKKIITFAPTYRGLNQSTAFYDYNMLNFDQLYQFCKDNNYAICFGKHHFITQEIPIKEEQKDLLYDLSHIKLNDLFYVTDILITDYSSCFYDFLLLKKPILFFVYDKALYTATRGVHRPIDKIAPGKICKSFDELMNALKNKEYGEKSTADFLIDKCITNKKIASDQIIDYVLLKQDVEGILYNGEKNEKTKNFNN